MVDHGKNGAERMEGQVAGSVEDQIGKKDLEQMKTGKREAQRKSADAELIIQSSGTRTRAALEQCRRVRHRWPAGAPRA